MVCSLDSRSSSVGLSPGWGTVLCSWVRHLPLIATLLFAQVYQCEAYQYLYLTGISSIEKKKYPYSLSVYATGKSSGLMSPKAGMETTFITKHCTYMYMYLSSNLGIPGFQQTQIQLGRQNSSFQFSLQLPFHLTLLKKKKHTLCYHYVIFFTTNIITITGNPNSDTTQC